MSKRVTVGLLVAVVVVVTGAVFFWKRPGVLRDVKQTGQVKKENWVWSDATEPELGRLYLTADKNGPGIFYKSKNISKDSSAYNPDLTPYKGVFVSLGNDFVTDGYFHFLKDPQPFDHDIVVELVSQIKTGDSDKYVYALINSESGKNDTLYRLDLEKFTLKKIWESSFTGPTGSRIGVPRMESVVDDQTVNFIVYSCIDCEGKVLGKLKVNISTGEESYLN